MKTALRTCIAIVLLASSVGTPLVVRHRAQSGLDAQRETLARQARRLSFLAEENALLSNLVAQANTAGPLTEEQLRELLRLRNERRRLGEQTNLLASLMRENDKLKSSLATGTSIPAELSPAELESALSVEMSEALKHILTALPAAQQQYALAHSNQPPTSLSDLQDYFPLVAGQKMPGLRTFDFVRDEGVRPGDALVLRGDVGRRADDRPEVRVYGFSDGRAVEVSSEDGRFDDWEKKHLDSAPAAMEEKIYLEAEGTARERAHFAEIGASLGISLEDTSRFFEKLKEQEKSLGPRFDDMRKNLTGSPEEQERQLKAIIEQELSNIAIATLGDKGSALVRKLLEDK